MKPDSYWYRYAALVGIFLLLKLGYTQADNQHLLWLLAPTSRLVELVTGSAATFSFARGFVHAGLGIYIDKSCSGFGFWLLSTTLLAGAGLRRSEARLSARWLLLPLLTYLVTLLANTSRILTAVLLLRVLPPSLQRLPGLHEAEGALAYLLFLVALYAGCDWLYHHYLLRRANPA